MKAIFFIAILALVAVMLWRSDDVKTADLLENEL